MTSRIEQKTDFPVFKELDRLGSMIDRAMELHNEIVPMTEEAKQQIVQLTEEIDGVKPLWKQLTEEVDRRFKSFEDMRGWTKESMDRLQKRQLGMEKVEEDIQDKQQELARLDGELRTQQSKFEIASGKLDSELEEKREKIGNAMQELDESFRSEKGTSEGKLKALEDQVAAKRASTTESLEHLEAHYKAKEEDLEGKRKDLEAQVTTKEENVRLKLQRLDREVEEKRQARDTDLKRLADEIEDGEFNTRTALRELDDEVNDKARTAQEEVRSFSAHVANHKFVKERELKTLCEQLSSKQQELVGLRSQKDDLDRTHGELSEQRVDLEGTLALLNHEVESQRVELGEIETEKTEVEREGRQLKVENERLADDSRYLYQQIAERVSESRRHGEEIQRVKEVLGGCEGKQREWQSLDAANTECARLRQEIENASQELSTARGENQSLRDQMSNDKGERDGVEADLRKQLEDARKVGQDAMTRLESSERKNGEFTKNAEKVQKRLREQRFKAETDSTAALANLNTITQSLGRIGRIETQVGTLLGNVASQGVQKEAMQKKDETHESVVKDLVQARTDLARISKERDDLEREKNKISIEMEDMKKGLTKMSTTIETQKAGLIGAANVLGKVRLIQEGITKYRNIIVASVDEKFSKVAGLEEKLKQEASSKTGLVTQLREETIRVADLERLLEGKILEATESKKIVDDKEAEISVLETSIEDNESAMRVLDEKLKDKRSTVQRENGELQRRLSDATRRIEELEESAGIVRRGQEDLDADAATFARDSLTLSSRRTRVSETPVRNVVREASPELSAEIFSRTERNRTVSRPHVGRARGEGTLGNESYINSLVLGSGLPLMRRSPETARGQVRVNNDLRGHQPEAVPRLLSDASLGLQGTGDLGLGEMDQESAVGQENPRKRSSTDQSKPKSKRTRRGMPEPHILHTDQDVPPYCQQFTVLDMSLPPAEWQFSWAMPDRVLKAFMDLISYDMDVRNGYIRQDPLHFNLESKCFGCATARCKGGCQFSRIGDGRALDVYHACEECRKRNRPCLIVTAPGEFVMLPVRREQATPQTDASCWIE